MSGEDRKEEQNNDKPIKKKEEEEEEEEDKNEHNAEDLLKQFGAGKAENRSLGAVANRFHGDEAHDFGPKDAYAQTSKTRMETNHLAKYMGSKVQEPQHKMFEIKGMTDLLPSFTFLPCNLAEPKMVFDIDSEYSTTSSMQEEYYEVNEVDYLEPEEFYKTTAVVSMGHSKDDIVTAIQNSHQQLQSERRQIRHQKEGFGFDVNYTHQTKSPGTTKAEVIILEIPDDYPREEFRKKHCILYTKLSGNGFAFQRYFRESVNRLQAELKDLHSLVGKSLPSMAVMGSDDAEIELTDQQKEEFVGDSLTKVLEVLQDEGKHGFTCESLRELTAQLHNISAKYVNQALTWTAKKDDLHTAFKNLLENDKIGAFKDSVIFRHILGFYNGIVKEEVFDFDSKPIVCRALTERGLYELIVRRGYDWVHQKAERTMTAEAVCDDIADFMENVERDYLSQGGKLPNAEHSKNILKVIASGKEGFTSFRKTCAAVLSKL